MSDSFHNAGIETDEDAGEVKIREFSGYLPQFIREELQHEDSDANPV